MYLTQAFHYKEWEKNVLQRNTFTSYNVMPKGKAS